MTDIDKLKADIEAELADERFLSRTHGRRSTARDGCGGPLCKKLMRDLARQRYRRKHPEVLRERPARDPITDIFIERFLEQYDAELADARAS